MWKSKYQTISMFTLGKWITSFNGLLVDLLDIEAALCTWRYPTCLQLWLVRHCHCRQAKWKLPLGAHPNFVLALATPMYAAVHNSS
jgi:hypothetical protein